MKWKVACWILLTRHFMSWYKIKPCGLVNLYGVSKRLVTSWRQRSGEDMYFFIEIGSCLVLAILRLSLVQFQFCVIINNMKAEVQTIYL